MMEKRFQAIRVEDLYKKAGSSEKMPQFDVGTKYQFDGKIWYVLHAKTDSGTYFRRIKSNFGDEQVLELRILQRDWADGMVEFLDATPNEAAIMAAAAAEFK